MCDARHIRAAAIGLSWRHEAVFWELLAMTHSHLTQWIEDADARQFRQTASWQLVPTTESHSLHLGEAILKMPARIHDAAVHALFFTRHPLRLLHCGR
jgi:hypothetical protein